MAAKADNTITLLLLNMHQQTPADYADTRAAVLAQLGITEAEATEQLADARDKAEQAAAKATPAEPAEAEDTASSTSSKG